MKSEIEAIGEKFLKHQFHLPVVGGAFHVGLPGHIELFGFEPRRPARDLPGMNSIGEYDEIAHRRVAGGDLMAIDSNSVTLDSGVVRLMVTTSKAGFASGGIIFGRTGSGITHAV